ncbi:MAG: hypothetical protein J5960_08120, partial [Desulfovibrio sp.]|nr:hypothetical protein [Desulfovibrio sp.]
LPLDGTDCTRAEATEKKQDRKGAESSYSMPTLLLQQFQEAPACLFLYGVAERALKHYVVYTRIDNNCISM